MWWTKYKWTARNLEMISMQCPVKGVSFLNSEVQELRSKEGVHFERIKGLEDKAMHQELYNRCENLCSFNLESIADEEDMKEVIYQLLERKRSIEEVKKIKFQRIPRIGKKSNEIRPILAHFLGFQNREYAIRKGATEMSH